MVRIDEDTNLESLQMIMRIFKTLLKINEINKIWIQKIAKKKFEFKSKFRLKKIHQKKFLIFEKNSRFQNWKSF